MDIYESVDRLFAVEDPNQLDDRRNFLNQLHMNYSKALSSRNRLMIGIGLVWFIGYAISGGLITEGEIASFKVENLDRTLIFIGPIIGVMSYFLMSTINLMHLLRASIFQCYKHLLPVAYELDLDALTIESDFVHVENIFVDQTHKFGTALSALVKLMLILAVLFVPLAAIIQIGTVIITARSSSHSTASGMTSIIFGMLFWLRGTSLLITDYKRESPHAGSSPPSARRGHAEGV